jgi:hypothetical protein
LKETLKESDREKNQERSRFTLAYKQEWNVEGPETAPTLKLNKSAALQQVCDIAFVLAHRVRHDLRRYPSDTPAKRVVAYWFSKAAKSFAAAVLLWNQGYWQDAAVLARTILEVSLQSLLFRKEPEKFAPQFFKHAEVQKHRLFADMDKHAEGEIKAGIASYFERLGLNPSDIEKWKNWWGKDGTIWDLAKEIEARQTYQVQYPALSFLVHGAPSAFSYYVLKTGPREYIDWDWEAGAPSASTYSLAETMFSAAPLSLLDVIAVLGELWGLDYDADLQAAREAVERYNKEYV